MINEILNLKNVSLAYQTDTDEIRALDSVSFGVGNGEFVAIIGPSGCGKTSVLSIIAGLLKPSGGKVTLYGEEIGKAKIRSDICFRKTNCSLGELSNRTLIFRSK